MVRTAMVSMVLGAVACFGCADEGGSSGTGGTGATAGAGGASGTGGAAGVGGGAGSGGASGVGGTAGSGGVGGVGGAGGTGGPNPDPPTPGVYFGSMGDVEISGYEICFNVNDDATFLEPADECDLDESGQPSSFAIRVVGVGAPDDCSFAFELENVATAIQASGAFLIVGYSPPGSTVEFSTTGSIRTDTANGTSGATNLPIVDECTFGGWAASPVLE